MFQKCFVLFGCRRLSGVPISRKHQLYYFASAYYSMSRFIHDHIPHLQYAPTKISKKQYEM